MSAFPMARIQYVILQFCADIRTASVRELHESFVCQNRDRAVKQRGVVPSRTFSTGGLKEQKRQ